MRILYVSSMYEDNMIGSIFNKGFLPNHAANKYHQLLCKGLAANGVDVDTYTTLPISKANSTKFYIDIPQIEEGNLKKKYIRTINFPGLKRMMLFIQSCGKGLLLPKDTIIIYDVLVISSSWGILLASKIKGLKSVAIVTDLPCFMHDANKKVILKMNNMLLELADGFIFLTRQMDDVVNPTSKPFIVLEGHVDANMNNVVHKPLNDQKKIVIYAGTLDEKYGISSLVKAFLECHKDNEELHIYGDGDYSSKLKEICKKSKSVVYFGSRANKEVVEAELSAYLLVNPRTSEGEYTKFSFPSKILEYMVSGTPILMAKLPGIPDEYDDYVYYFNEKNEQGLKNALRSILDMECCDIEEKGQKAKKFVLNEKNNITQANSILNFINLLGRTTE